jgi:hypothetical protein
MKTPEEIAQWVINNRYPKNENEKVSDVEMYYSLVESITNLCNLTSGSSIVNLDTSKYDELPVYVNGKKDQ